MSDMFKRTKMLLGEEAFKNLQSSHVVIFGVGGVGGTVAESLLRSGVGHLTLVDCDSVDVTNLNRQILFVKSEVGERKVEAAKKRLLSINEEAKIDIIDQKVDELFFEKNPLKADFFIDAIDDANGKLAISKYCLENGFQFLVSLGMGNRITPQGFKKIALSKTENDPLAKKLRHFFKEAGLDIKKIPTVLSLSGPDVKSETPSSLMMVPSSAGLYIASCALEMLAKIE